MIIPEGGILDLDNRLSPSEGSLLLAKRLQADSAVVLDYIDDLQGELYPEEEALIKGAIAKRTREFRSGRTAARKCMRHLDIDPSPILMGSRGEPTWPDGCVGSISHCGDYCLAILSISPEIISLGADIEEIGRVKSHLWPRVFVETEKLFLSSLAPRDAAKAATILFSAKEAFFKWQYPLTFSWLEFLDTEVVLKQDDGFTIESIKPLKHLRGDRLYRGSYFVLGDCCIAIIGIDHDAAASLEDGR